MEKKYITIKEAAKILGVTPLTLRNWDNSGKFPAGRHPMSNYRVYIMEDLEKVLKEIEESKGKKHVSKNTVKRLVVKHLS
jgi:DNA-binding transcriptional MerR regulator